MPNDKKHKKKIPGGPCGECESCFNITPEAELEPRYLPEYQQVMKICNNCKQQKVHWHPNDAIPDGDATI